MTIKEKVSYIKGLVEGMEIDNKDLGKVILVMIDTITDMADEIEDLTDNALDIGEELDELSDDLANVEETLEDLVEELESGGAFDDDDYADDLFEDDDDDYDYDENGYEEENTKRCSGCGKQEEVDFLYDITCPNCSTEIELDEVDIENELVVCPDCRYEIELEIDEVGSDEDY